MPSTTKVVIADDSHAVRMMLKETLARKGLEVIDAEDGIDCIKKVFMHWPSFVILDVMMPKMNGYQACRFLKNHPWSADIPVMILTAMDQGIDQFWSNEVGANYYMPKSPDVDKLVGSILNVLESAGPAVERQAIQVSDNDVLVFVNEILDAKLYELTLTNEITSLSYQISNLRDLVTKCAEFLFKIIKFYFAGFALVEEDRVRVLVWSPYGPGSHIDAFRNYITDVLGKGSGVEITQTLGDESLPPNYAENSHSVVYGDTLTDMKRRDDKLVSISVFVDYSKHQDDIMNKIGSVVNHLQLVLNNFVLYEKVLDLSTIDDLTQTYNRRKIIEILKNEMERSSRYGMPLSVIMADIDFFKNVNDTYGHKTGDLVLKRVAALLKSSLRKVDFMGRFGGEEFIIISPETETEKAALLADRIRKMFEMMRIEGVKEQVTLSFGISSTREAASMDELIHEADMALYDAKRAGRNNVKVYSRADK